MPAPLTPQATPSQRAFGRAPGREQAEMISIRKERPPDVASARSAARRSFWQSPLAQKFAAPAGRPITGRRARLRRDRWEARHWHRPALEYRVRHRSIGAAARAGGGCSRLPQSGHRRGACASRACRCPPARPSRGRPRRRRALLQPFRLLHGEDRGPAHARSLRTRTGCWRSNSCRARSRAPAACCAHPASGCRSRPRCLRRIISARMSWTPG